jgi:hypothetical protein
MLRSRAFCAGPSESAPTGSRFRHSDQGRDRDRVQAGGSPIDAAERAAGDIDGAAIKVAKIATGEVEDNATLADKAHHSEGGSWESDGREPDLAV